MPKIILDKGEKIDVNLSDAIRVKDDWEKEVSKIKIGDRIIKYGRIKEVDLGGETFRNKPYNLSDPEDRRIIKDFEKELIEAKKQEIDSLSFYGEPVKYIDGMPGNYVVNELLGLCHAGIVKYCLDNDVISNNDGWRVVSPGYINWSEKVHALDELKLKREFAEKQEMGELDELAKMEEDKKQLLEELIN